MKKFISLLLSILITTSLSITAFAAPKKPLLGDNIVEITVPSPTGAETVTVIDLNDTGRYQTDANGNIMIEPFADFSEHTIDSGSIMTYTNDGSGHSLARDQKVTFKARFNKSISWECGYESSSYKASMGTGTGTSISKSVKMPADGTYDFYIKNKSSSEVTVKSGSITY